MHFIRIGKQRFEYTSLFLIIVKKLYNCFHCFYNKSKNLFSKTELLSFDMLFFALLFIQSLSFVIGPTPNDLTHEEAIMNKVSSIKTIDYTHVNLTVTKSCCSDKTYTYKSSTSTPVSTDFYFEKGVVLEKLFIQTKNTQERFHINDTNMPNELSVILGCDSSECRKSTNNLYRPVVEPVNQGIALYSYGNGRWWVLKHPNELFLFVNGTEASDISFDFSNATSEMKYYVDLTRYAATGHFNKIEMYNKDSLPNLNILPVCRVSVTMARYVLTTQSIINQDCTCTSKDNSVNINFQTKFNYPDCNYNSSLFDLNLNTTNNVIQREKKYDFGLSMWNSLILLENVLYIFNSTNNQILTLNEFKMSSGFSVYFDVETVIKSLKITSRGNFTFNKPLKIVTFTINDNIKDQILFFINSTYDNDIQTPLTNCGNRVIHKDYLNTLCDCEYNENGTFTFQGEFMADCTKNLRTKLNLIIGQNNYIIQNNENWGNFSCSNEAMISSTSNNIYINSNHCLFTEIVYLEANVICKILYVYNKTRIIVDNFTPNKYYLSIGDIYFVEEIFGINQNGIIQIRGGQLLSYYSNQKISLNFFVSRSTTKCVDFVSSSTPLNDFLFEVTSTKILLGSKLYRICYGGDNYFDYTIQCNLTGSIYSSFQSYQDEVLHCPINNMNTTVIVSTNVVDLNESFSGTFDQQETVTKFNFEITSNYNFNDSTKTVLFVQNESVGGNTLNIQTSSEKLLLGNKYKFANTINSNNFKNGNKYLSIEYNSSNKCNSLLITNLNSKCLHCDISTVLDNGECLDFSNKCVSRQRNNTTTYCEECESGFEPYKEKCNKCPDDCLRCFNSNCLLCEVNYQINSTFVCSEVENKDTTILFYNISRVYKCKEGYYNTNSDCTSVPTKCVSYSQETKCKICKSNEILNAEETCSTLSGVITTNNKVPLICKPSYYLFNNTCKLCNETFGDLCQKCTINSCVSCGLTGVVNSGGSCESIGSSECTESNNTYCSGCSDKSDFIKDDVCIQNINNCDVTNLNGKCVNCVNGFYFDYNTQTCVLTPQTVNDCEIFNLEDDRCVRCKSTFYLTENHTCLNCSEDCLTCTSSTNCILCNSSLIVKNGFCVSGSNVSDNCSKVVTGTSICALCVSKTFRNEDGKCENCLENCLECHGTKTCTLCESNHFLLTNSSACISYDNLINCEDKSVRGCLKCSSGYFVENQFCSSCDSKTTNCETCNSVGKCTSCKNDFILNESSECVSKSQVDKCVEVSNSKCTKCTFWHVPDNTKTKCITQAVWWVILLCVLFVIFIFIIIIASSIFIFIAILNHRKTEKLREKYCLFDMKKTNIEFVKTEIADIVVNKTCIEFCGATDETSKIPVATESRELICVGNVGRNVIKVQFSLKDNCTKYSIRTEPKIMTIPKGKAIEFEVFLTPNYSCNIEDKIVLISANLKKGETSQLYIETKAETEMSTRLDPDELIEEKQLGEGSFGVVYKGKFRGNEVAIKKMKEFGNDKTKVDEFEKEVSMLDKFRSDYVVHFYGAVFIPNKICMVTEYAQFGSLNDLMKHKKAEEVVLSVRVKIIYDAAKGLEYLHNNGILHRDIKPDNFLVFSLEKEIDVNAKLTDFGSSRNVNMMMTNMTFTKGIGTPKYMAPEVLNKELYKKSADVYSFAITMYECFGWGNAFPKEHFSYPWKIADFISAGSRPSQYGDITDEEYLIIVKCWGQIPSERIQMGKVVDLLKETRPKILNYNLLYSISLIKNY
ncbi:protein serine/threonine kinase, putative [Entamoeba invadens IP1]|uniref:Protein serine/threonine kinase, putative n=1 Tax=Entamoeba invadens IP1 TaxID=370355 RepID=A0A0A1U7J1_ENTIV|nr:protein serine/threonine kinase, putative [Entamoeba invadens IP1]ELP87955.1 protein serine/threonine kinase, putative [Entamoeba invadens IP1]|eukprot:XP_004254726.1 protein serine/threonine kinase, putative [Entamoeba invadens IP1]